MTDPDTAHRQAVALFRYGLIADLVHLPPGSPGLYQRLREKAQGDYTIPGSRRTRVAAETWRDWLKRYRQGGFEALMPKPRADRGRSRALAPAVAERLLTLKEQNPRLSVAQLIGQVRANAEVPAERPLPASTVHRLLTQHGLMNPPTDAPDPRDRRRFAFERAGQLWMSDVMHGPAVFAEGRRKRKTYLIAFLDDATRVIPFATFAWAENTRAFLPVFKQALRRRGLPERLFVDNGANYRSHPLALIGAKLGIALIHARPYQPQSKGKQERWFRTLRAQRLAPLSDADSHSLEALNRRLWGWIEGEYHQAPHRSLEGQTPLERWAERGAEVRYPEPPLNLDEVFLFETKAVRQNNLYVKSTRSYSSSSRNLQKCTTYFGLLPKRKVQKDRTVSLEGVIYEVDAALVGETVSLRYDPAAPAGRPLAVWHLGQPVGLARVLDAYANGFVKRHRPTGTLTADSPPQNPPPGLSLRSLDTEEND